MAVCIDRVKETEIVRISPGIAAAIRAWGKPVTNEDLGAQCATDKERKQIADTGFEIRHHPDEPTPFLANRPEIAQKMTQISIETGGAAMRAMGWDDGADLMYMATSGAPDERGEYAKVVAKALNIDQVYLSYLACDGGGAALFDALKRAEVNPVLANNRIMVIATEPLGYFADPKKPTADLPIFGNASVALCFQPRSIATFGGKTVVIHDKEGVIRPPKTYDLPPVEKRVPHPDWYEVKEGGEEVFACSKEGAFLSLPTTGGDFMEMDGEGTARYFKYLVTGVQMEVLREYYKRFDKPEDRIDICVSHQPSGVVNRHTAKELAKLLRNEGLQNIDKETWMPWMMREVGMGNASSATSLAAFSYMAKLGLLLPKKRFVWSSYGAGAAVTVWPGEIIGTEPDKSFYFSWAGENGDPKTA